MNDPLEKLIREWSSRHAADKDRLSAIEGRIAAGMRREARLGDAASFPGRAPLFFTRTAWVGIGAAAVAMIGFFSFVRLASPDAKTMAMMPETRITAMSRLFTEADRLFGDRLQWVSQSGKDVDLGVDAEGNRPSENGPMALHVAVVMRSSPRGRWQKVWEADVVARTEETVEVVPDAQSGNRLAFWLFPLGGQCFAVDSRLQLKMPLCLKADKSVILKAGEPSQVLDATDGQKEYRVFQTLTPLRKGGASC